MRQPTRIAGPIQLLVEGKAQKNFFEAFVKHLDFQHTIQIHDFGGVTELGDFLGALAGIPGFDLVTRVGIVRDAEESVEAARRSVDSSLRNAGLPTPGDAEAGSAPAVHVLILPDGEEPGMLETLLCQAFENDPVNDCIDKFFDCARLHPGVEFRRPDKARAQAFLATRPLPGVSVGVAAKKNYWFLDHEAFAGVRAFLTGLLAR